MARTQAEAFAQAQHLALNKPPVLVGRAHVLSQIAEKALEAYFQGLPDDQGSAGRVEQVAIRVGNYLRMGYLYFSDLGISTESQFRFIELGVHTVGLSEDIEKLPSTYEEALAIGHNRKEEYQRSILDGYLAEDAREYANKALP